MLFESCRGRISLSALVGTLRVYNNISFFGYFDCHHKSTFKQLWENLLCRLFSFSSQRSVSSLVFQLAQRRICDIWHHVCPLAKMTKSCPGLSHFFALWHLEGLAFWKQSEQTLSHISLTGSFKSIFPRLTN